MPNKDAEKSFRRDQVVTIINSVITRVSQPQDTSHDMLLAELQNLKAVMEELRSELGATAADSVLSEHIPVAYDELDAVIGTTESATQMILGACENIVATVRNGPSDMVQKVEAHITDIYEACTFQDITGQRINKVVRTLKVIDTKVTGLLSTIGSFGDISTPPEMHKPANNLLNGPALPQSGGLSQSEIDRLLDGM